MPDFALGNVVGQSYCFTALCPIRRHAVGSPDSFQTRIREYLSQLPSGGDSPFARIGSMHLCRLLVIDDVPFEGFPAHEDHLQSSYLLFTASISGDPVSCLSELLAAAPDVVHNVWVNCVGYPGIESPSEFLAYLKKCQIDASFFFGGYPQATLPEVLRALQTQTHFTRFVIGSQATPPEELQSRFRAFMEDLRQQPPPRPGTL